MTERIIHVSARPGQSLELRIMAGKSLAKLRGNPASITGKTAKITLNPTHSLQTRTYNKRTGWSAWRTIARAISRPKKKNPLCPRDHDTRPYEVNTKKKRKPAKAKKTTRARKTRKNPEGRYKSTNKKKRNRTAGRTYTCSICGAKVNNIFKHRWLSHRKIAEAGLRKAQRTKKSKKK